MKNVFLIDENTFRFACTGKDEAGNTYWLPLQLVANIAANCHKIVLFNELRSKYSRHADALERTRQTAVLNVISVINELLSNSDKVIYLPEIFTVDLTSAPEDDRQIVQAAIQAKAILVTDDCRLLKAVRESGIIGKWNLRAMLPRDAIALSGESTLD
jgi:hypothetical protein